MSATQVRPLHVYVVTGQRYALLRGPARQLIANTSMVATWSPGDRGYLVRAEHIPDLLALADSQGGWCVRVHRVEAS